jgi:hypothetical protein
MFKNSFTSALLAGTLLAGAAAAQDVIPVSGPMHYARLDMATGKLETFDHDPGPKIGPGDSNPTVLYENMTIGTGFSIGTGNAIQTNHHMGWGVANFGGLGATITQFTMVYATTVTAAQGTVAFRMRFYDGALGFGNKGTVNPNGDLIVTGLPNSVAPPGSASVWTVDVTPVTPMVMSDGPIGWSYNSDSTTNGTTIVSAPMLAAAPVGPGVINAYDRYNEATEAYVGTFQFNAPNVGGFPIRLTGRTNGVPPPPAFVNYGVKSGVDFTGTGSGTPGSIDNVLHIKSTNGKKAILVVGLTQSEVVNTNLGLTFYAVPWLIQINDLQLGALDGTLDLPAPLPLSLSPGMQLSMQVFAQKLTNVYGKYSEGLELTVQ